MVETREPDSKKKTSTEEDSPTAETSSTRGTKEKIRQQSVDLTGRLGSVVQAGTEAATEVAVGTVRVATNSFTMLAQSVGDNFSTVAKEATKVAQRGIDRFFSVLDSFATDSEKKSASEAGSTHETKKNN